MLIDRHSFEYHAALPWPLLDHDNQIDWVAGIQMLETWLICNVGQRPCLWAWNDGQSCYKVGVAFKWEQDRTLCLLKWS